MSNEEKRFVVHYSEPQQELLLNTKGDFVSFVSDGDTPSQALRKVMGKYDLIIKDHSVIFSLLKAAYSDIHLGSIRGYIIDSNYPNKNCSMTDLEFDNLVNDAISSDRW